MAGMKHHCGSLHEWHDETMGICVGWRCKMASRCRIPPMVERSRSLPSFWTLQLLGWGAFTLVFFLATLRYLKTREDLVYSSVCILGDFAASFALLAFCRRACLRSDSLSQTIMRVALLSTVLAASSVVVAKCARALMSGSHIQWNLSRIWF